MSAAMASVAKAAAAADAKSSAAAADASASASASAAPKLQPSAAVIRAGPEPSFFKALSGAVERNRVLEFAGYAQLATTNASAAADADLSAFGAVAVPAVRTVRMRGGVLKDLRAVMFTTDARSAKVKDLIANPLCELNWFFPLTKEQFRLTCVASVVGLSATATAAAAAAADDAKATALRVTQWQSLAIPTRQLFDAAPPGTPLKRVALGDLDRYEAQPIDDKVPSPHFLCVLLHPFRCDHLTLPPSGMVDPQKVLHHDAILKPSRQQRRALHTLKPAPAATATAGAATGAASSAGVAGEVVNGYQWSVLELNP